MFVSPAARRLKRLLLSVLALPFLGLAAAPAAVPDDHVMVLLKILPEKGFSASPQIRLQQESCPACVQLHDPAFERFNARESLLQLLVPRGRYLELLFSAPSHQARRVLVNRSDMAVQREEGKITVALPPLWEDSIWSAALETDIVEPGMVLRVETADPARRAGAYTQGVFPALERRAADNVTFAMREAVRRLGLGQAVEEAHTGTIMIMGFDTNFPAGHNDAPPHLHMHLRWPNNVGTQIGHYYLGKDGLFSENIVGVRALNAPQRRFGRGQTFTTIDNRGKPVYAITITEKGWLRIDRPDGASCLLAPAGLGFQDGVSADCGPLGTAKLAVTIDPSAVLIRVRTNDIIETLRYDPDTGDLKSPVQPPLTAPSTQNPE